MKFLEKLCDDVDGTLTFVAEWAISVIRNATTPTQLEQKYLQCKYFSATNESLKLEVAMIILTGLSYGYSSRDDLIKSLDDALTAALPILC